jgi:esterase/lipase
MCAFAHLPYDEKVAATKTLIQQRMKEIEEEMDATAAVVAVRKDDKVPTATIFRFFYDSVTDAMRNNRYPVS